MVLAIRHQGSNVYLAIICICNCDAVIMDYGLVTVSTTVEENAAKLLNVLGRIPTVYGIHFGQKIGIKLSTIYRSNNGVVRPRSLFNEGGYPWFPIRIPYEILDNFNPLFKPIYTSLIKVDRFR